MVQFVRGAKLERVGLVWKAENSIIKLVLMNKINQLKQRWLNILNRYTMDLRPEWNGDLNRAYNREEWKKLVLAAKNLDGM